MESTATIDSNDRKNSNDMRNAVLRLIFISLVLPIVLFAILSNYMSETYALLISGMPPAIEALVTIIRDRRLDIIPCAVVLSIIISAIVAALTNDARLLLVKDSFLTIGFGATFLGSMCCGKENLIWYYNRQFQGPEAKAKLEEMYAIPAVCQATNKMCLVWGSGMLLEAAIRIVLIYLIQVSIMAYLSPLLMAFTMISLGLWTRWYVMFLRAKAAKQSEGSPLRATESHVTTTPFKKSSSSTIV